MKHHIIKSLAALVLGPLLHLPAVAQTTVAATGGTVENSRYSISYSVGQVAVGSDITETLRLNEGVQQPLTVEDVSINKTDNPTPIAIYPNPTTMSVTLRREGDANSAEVRIYCLDGRLLHTTQWDGTSLSIDLNAFAAGVYMLQVDNKTYKITKQ